MDMDLRDINKTTLSAIGGHFEFVRMPFEFANAPATFHRVMENILARRYYSFFVITPRTRQRPKVSIRQT